MSVLVPSRLSISGQLGGEGRIVAMGLACLATYYALMYLAHPALPGNHSHPDGWWTWLDQEHYLKSARAFARFDFSSSQHWYPPGYALLGAPFTLIMPKHPFFLVNLTCLLGTAVLFIIFCRRINIPSIVAIVVFLFPLLDPRLMESWVVPWTTSPATLALWGLALSVQVALRTDGTCLYRAAAMSGLLLGSLILIRPTDAAFGAVMVLPLAAVLAHRATRGELGARTLAAAALAGACGLGVTLALAIGLHLMIYGPVPSDYMIGASALGFTTFNFPLRAFVLLVEPRAWFSDGIGLLQRLPWLALGFVGLGIAWRYGTEVVSVAFAAVTCLFIYICFVDLGPVNLWRYGNIHYFKWLWPAFSLLALLAVRQLQRWDVVAVGTAAGLLIPLTLKAHPTRLPVDATAFGAFLSGARPGFEDAAHNPHLLVTARGTLQNVVQFRTAIVPGGLLVMGVHQPLSGPVQLLPRPETRPNYRPYPTALGDYRHDAMIGVRWSAVWPCWLPPYACARRAWE